METLTRVLARQVYYFFNVFSIKVYKNNLYIITGMLYHIFIYSDKEMLTAG